MITQLRDAVDVSASRVLQFSAVGSVAAGFQIGLLWIFVDKVGLYFLFGAGVAILITIAFQYQLNNIWTFADRDNSGAEYIRGLARTGVVRGSAIPLQMGLLYALVSQAGLGILLSNLVAILLCGIYRFVFDSAWTWQESPS